MSKPRLVDIINKLEAPSELANLPAEEQRNQAQDEEVAEWLENVIAGVLAMPRQLSRWV